MCQALACAGWSMYCRNFQPPAWAAGLALFTRKNPAPPGLLWPGALRPGRSPVPGTSDDLSMTEASKLDPTSWGVSWPLMAWAIVLVAVDVSMSIDDCWVTRAR